MSELINEDDVLGGVSCTTSVRTAKINGNIGFFPLGKVPKLKRPGPVQCVGLRIIYSRQSVAVHFEISGSVVHQKEAFVLTYHQRTGARIRS